MTFYVFFKGGLHTHNEYAASGKGTMEIKEQYPFKFFDQVFDIYLTDDMQFMVPLRPLCEILGLSIGAQLSRIKRDVIMAEHLHTLRPKIVSKSGAAQVRDTACLAIQRLDYFMGGIDHERVSPERRDEVIKYKKEFADAIYAYFRTKRLPSDVLAELDAALPLKTQAFHQKMDEAAALHGELIAEHDKRISGLDKRVADLEARLVGTDFINSNQASQYIDAVTALGNLLKEQKSKMASPYAVIHNEVKKKFHVGSYQLIPEKEFPAVLEFLAAWWKREAPLGKQLPDIFTTNQTRLL